MNMHIQYPGDDPGERGLTVKVVEITPELADRWLGLNRDNRREKRVNIARFARDIQDGQWPLTGETIIFDSNGYLRNGQNRLQACRRAGKSFRSLVVWGIDPDAARSLDSGSARTYSDVLDIEGQGEYANTSALGALAATVWRWEQGHRIVGGGQAVNPTLREMLDTVERHPLLPESITPAVRASKTAYLRPPRVGAYCHYRFALIDRDLADEFFRRLNEVDFDPGDGSLRLLYLTLQRMGGRDVNRPDAYKVLYYTIKTWRVWRGIDQPVTKLQAGSTLPEVQ